LSPKHTDEYFVQKARDAASLEPHIIYLKDPGGLLTVERVRSLVPDILANIGNIPLELHSHCTTGLAPLAYLEAIKLGVTTIHTAIPPLANGSSSPSVLNIARNARSLGYATSIDEEAIEHVSDHFTRIAKREGLPIGVPPEYDLYQYAHQVPGGVISNLKHQLGQLSLLDRIDDVLEETIQVRRDLGYPIMVTPFSQFVVSQAAINVMLGERYKEVTDELIHYALGFWGEEASSAIASDTKDTILNRPRGEELTRTEIYEPSIEEVRGRLGGVGVSDDELLLRYIMGGKDEIELMRAAGPIKPYLSSEAAELAMIRELVRRRDCSYVRIEKQDFSLTLQEYH